MQSGHKFDYPALPQTLEELELEYKREAVDLARMRDKEEDDENFRHREVRMLVRLCIYFYCQIFNYVIEYFKFLLVLFGYFKFHSPCSFFWSLYSAEFLYVDLFAIIARFYFLVVFFIALIYLADINS